MYIPSRFEQRACIAALHADLSACLKRIDMLGFDLAANHVDHAIAIIEAEVCPDARVIDSEIISKALRVSA
jgi:hypothetical protein